MELSKSYERIKGSIVGFEPKYMRLKEPGGTLQPLHPIIGTGFVVREDGLIATNDHVVRAFDKLFKAPRAQKEEWPVVAWLWTFTENAVLRVPLEVLGKFEITDIPRPHHYLGPKTPDLAFVHVKAKGLPAVEVDDSTVLKEGLEVATAGFPMGTNALMALGGLQQLTPTLQRGIISAVLPFACARPHAFTINVMVQGGASGSPVFLTESGKTIGVVYRKLSEIRQTKAQDKYEASTNISYVVPSYYIAGSLRSIEGDPNFRVPEDAKSLDEIIKDGEIRDIFDDGVGYEVSEMDPCGDIRKTIMRVKL
jgi:S1-C subfamily serine protease